MKDGFIVIHRKMIDWEWFTDLNVCHLFLYCLLRANHKDEKWRGHTINRGSFITSLEHIKNDTGLSIQKIRTALNKLNLTNEITYETTSQYSIISIKNYNLYQDYNKQDNKQITNEQQTSNKRVTTNNNDNNDNNDNNKEEVEEEKLKNLDNFYGEFKNVYLSSDRYDSLKGLIMNDRVFLELINELSTKIAEKSDKYKPYDEKFPNAHFSYLRNFWKFRQNNPQKFIAKVENIDEYSAALKRGAQMYKEYKEKQNAVK